MWSSILDSGLQADSKSHRLVPTTRSKLGSIVNNGVSDLQPWSAFIFSICVILVVATCYLAEKVLLEVVYRATYQKLVAAAAIDGHERRRRGFVSHHVAAFFKILLLSACAVPFFRLVLPGPASFRTPLHGGSEGGSRSGITIGDMLLVAGQLYCAYYTWELSYRASLASYISMLHHTVLLVVGQLGMALSAYPEVNHEATIEFYLCIIWGAFDVVSEIPVHLAMILYRAVDGGGGGNAGSDDGRWQRRWVSRALFFCTGWCSCCTAAEMGVSAWLLKESWAQWDLGFQIATPIILLIWGVSQCFSSWQIFGLAMAERRRHI